MELNTTLLYIIAISSLITAVSSFIIARNLAGQKLLQKGITFLLEKRYEDAILSFEKLAQKSVPNNQGLYYKAFTLLNRNKHGDKANAVILMREVIEKNLGCRRNAEEYLNK